MAIKTLTSAQLQSKIKILEASLQQAEASLKERQRLLEYVASLLVEIDTKFQSSPVLTSLPKKFNFWWLLSNWRSVLEFIEFVILKIKEFATNIKIEKNASAQ